MDHGDVWYVIFQIGIPYWLEPQIPIKIQEVVLCRNLDGKRLPMLLDINDGLHHDLFSQSKASHFWVIDHSTDGVKSGIRDALGQNPTAGKDFFF